MSIGDRLKELRGTDPRDSFAERFAKSRNTIMYYESEKRKPDSEFIVALCREYQVSPTWLLLGEGPKELAVAKRDSQANNSTPKTIDQDTLTAAISSVEQALTSRRRAIPPDKKAKLISLVYDLLMEEGVDSGRILQLVDIAC